jgi:hypothetical protein
MRFRSFMCSSVMSIMVLMSLLAPKSQEAVIRLELGVGKGTWQTAAFTVRDTEKNMPLYRYSNATAFTLGVLGFLHLWGKRTCSRAPNRSRLPRPVFLSSGFSFLRIFATFCHINITLYDLKNFSARSIRPAHLDRS